MKQYINLKDGIDIFDLLFIQPELMVVLGELSRYCKNKKLPFQITSIIRSEAENKLIKAESKTHVEGRAFDISVKGWTKEQINNCVNHFGIHELNFLYGAISSKTKKPNLAYYHVGTAPHIHFQVRKK